MPRFKNSEIEIIRREIKLCFSAMDCFAERGSYIKKEDVKPSKDYAATLREAIAREVEHMSRGHVAHESIVLDHLVNRIRSSTLDYISADMVKDYALIAAADILLKVGPAYGPCINYAIQRIDEVNLYDPMEPFSDKASWWRPFTSAAFVVNS